MKITKPCEHCGTSVSRRPSGMQAPHIYCSKRCSNRANALIGPNNPNWGGGSYIQAGYRMVRIAPNEYNWEHRIVMEQMLGRPLTPEEKVHHRNHDRLDNRPENLELMANQSEHRLHHPVTRGIAIHDWESRGGPCRRCNGTERPHYAKGLCTRCYQRKT